jgi:PAT family beta-lactamase induction signal transducer AmpG
MEQGTSRLTRTQSRARWSIPALATILYFSQGLPFGIVEETLNLYLSALKLPLTQIGLMSSVGYAWTLKFLWAPLVDATGTYRRWIVGALVAIAACIATFGLTPAASMAFWIAAAVLAFASATQDIAIDAMSIRITPPELLGIVNSIRVAAYRVALIAAGGGIAAAAGRIGWNASFLAAALIPIVIMLVVLFTLPAATGAAERHENPLRALAGWFRRPGATSLIAVVLLYRLGDNAIAPMIKPFWIARGFSAVEVAQVTTTLALILTIAGAFTGGAFVLRFGIFRGLVWLGLAQLLSNVVYAIVAGAPTSRAALYIASSVEAFAFGLGTAAFLSFVMFICDKTNAATEYAALTAVFALSRTFARSMSGFFAQDLGFAPYFWVTAAVALPGLLLLPLVKARTHAIPDVIVSD